LPSQVKHEGRVKSLCLHPPDPFFLLFHSSNSFRGFSLRCFFLEWIFFSSILFSMALSETEVGIRRLFGRFNLIKRSRSLSKASFRFSAWDRCSVAITVIPEGRCFRRTAVSTLFFLWPPGPLDR